VNLFYVPQAAAELREAAEWFESKEHGLGQRFVAEVEATIELILAHPLQFARYEGKRIKRIIRRALVKRFTYVILYEVADDGIRIVSVSHGSRQPGYWKDR
jgi:plasmid stabilization system protein ParE